MGRSISSGRGTYWTLRPEIHRRIAAPGHPDRDRRLDWESAKTRVLSVMRQRAQRGEPALTNAEVRAITWLDRKQVNRLVHGLEAEGQVRLEGHGRGARYILSASDSRAPDDRGGGAGHSSGISGDKCPKK